MGAVRKAFILARVYSVGVDVCYLYFRNIAYYSSRRVLAKLALFGIGFWAFAYGAAAFIGEKYIKIEGYEEEIYNFYELLQDFKNAKDALKNLKKDSNEYKDIIYDLGIKALQENSKWVMLHDKMRVKPSLE